VNAMVQGRISGLVTTNGAPARLKGTLYQVHVTNLSGAAIKVRIFEGNTSGRLLGSLPVADATHDTLVFRPGAVASSDAAFYFLCDAAISSSTGVLINNGAGYSVGDTALVVDTVDATTQISVGQTLLNAAGTAIGVVTAVSALLVTIGGGIKVALADDAPLHTVDVEITAIYG